MVGSVAVVVSWSVPVFSVARPPPAGSGRTTSAVTGAGLALVAG